MPWLSFKNGLLLKLADLLQTVAAWLTPAVHAPGLQGDSHPQAEDDVRAQSMERYKMERYKVSRPPEDWSQHIDESPCGDGAETIADKVVRDRPPFAARHAAVESPRAVEEQQHSSQRPGSEPGRSNWKVPTGSVAKSVLPHQSQSRAE